MHYTISLTAVLIGLAATLSGALREPYRNSAADNLHRRYLQTREAPYLHARAESSIWSHHGAPALVSGLRLSRRSLASSVKPRVASTPFSLRRRASGADGLPTPVHSPLTPPPEAPFVGGVLGGAPGAFAGAGVPPPHNLSNTR